MQRQNEQGESSWGARVNAGRWRNAQDWPTWANSRQQEKWSEHGLVLWDHEEQQITRLSAKHSLQLLDHLRMNNDWREHGLVVGEPAKKIFLDEPEREPEPSFIDSMSLSPNQLQVVLDLLERREADLQRLRETEAEDRKRRLSRVYTILLDLAAHQELGDSSDTASIDE